jgi:hypothetical protein
MWQAIGTPVDGQWLNLEPTRVLYEFDGPRIFICNDLSGVSEFLAFQCGEEQGRMRFLVVPSSEVLEHKLTSGEMNLHDALMRPKAWLFDLDFGWNLIGAWSVQVENLPQQCMPQPGVMLWSHLTPRAKKMAARFSATETNLAPVYLGTPSCGVVAKGAA